MDSMACGTETGNTVDRYDTREGARLNCISSSITLWQRALFFRMYYARGLHIHMHEYYRATLQASKQFVCVCVVLSLIVLLLLLQTLRIHVSVSSFCVGTFSILRKPRKLLKKL